jgi:hypothetical protein
MEINNLKAYLANIGMTMKDFCEEIDCCHTYMSAVVNGRAVAGHRLAKDIYDATDGTINLRTRLRKRHQKGNKCQNQDQNCCEIQIR